MAAGKTYSAGTIFLQVVPVFGDVQNAIKRQAKDLNKELGDEMERGGQEAGARASKAIASELEKGSKESAERSARETSTAFQKEFKKSLKGMNDALEPIDLKLQSNEVRKQIKGIRDEIADLDRAPIRIDADVKRAAAAVRILHAQLEGLQHDAKLNAALDIKRASASAAAMVKQLDSVQKAAEIEVRWEGKQAERAMGVFEAKMRKSARAAADALGDSLDPEIRKLKAELEALADVEVGVDMRSEEALRKLDELTRKAHNLSLTSVDIETKVNAAKSEAELSGLLVAAKTLSGTDVEINVDVDAGAAVAKMGILKSLFSAAPGTDAAANSFRSFNAVILAGVTLIPALIPVIGALGGALLGLIPILAAVGGGLGAMMIGFSGIGDAVGALGEQADSAAKDSASAGKTMEGASYAVADAKTALADAERSAGQASADAARAVADARRSAADAIEDALDRQRDAQEAYRDSVNEVREAEADLREARKRAAEELQRDREDNADRIRQNALDIREAQLAAFDTTNSYNATMADGASTAYDKEAAEVAMLQARERLHELRDEQGELAKERRTQSKRGVKDNSDVESAQDALTDALERQKDAQEAVGDAAEAVAEARIDGARRVQDALRAQSRTEAEGARSVARAQEALRRANEAYGQALYDTGELGSASMQKVEEAMGKLGSAGRKFARFIFSLRAGFLRLRDAVQSEMLPGVQRAMQSVISTYGPQFTSFMAKMGGVVGDLFEAFAKSLSGPAWRTFFGLMDTMGPKMLREFGMGTINWMETFANIMVAVAPFAERMSSAMLGISEAVNRWSASDKGVGIITGFMEYAARVGPMVLEFLSAFVRAALNLAQALAPWGEMVLNALVGILDWIAEMDPKELGLIASSVIALVIAFQAAVGVVALVNGGMAAFALTGSKIILNFLGVAGILAALAIRFETVRDVLMALLNFVADHIGTIAKLAGAIMAVVTVVRIWRAITATMLAIHIGYAAAITGSTAAVAGHGIVTRTTAAITKGWIAVQAALNATMLAFPLVWILVAIVAVIAIIVLLWKKNETFRRIVTAAWEGIKRVAEVVFDAVVKAFWWVVEAAQELWKKLQPIFRWIGGVIKKLWTSIVKPYFTFIIKLWTAVFKGIQSLWKNVLWPVLDLIFTIIRKLWTNIVKPYFSAIIKLWTSVFKGMKVVWNSILKPVIDLIFTLIKKLWTGIFKPILGWIGKRWDEFSRGLKVIYEKYIKPMLEKFMDLLGGREGLQNKFETVVGAIKKIWEGLKKVVGTPIKFVIETVLNNGIIAGFNKVAKFVGSDPMKPIPVPGALQNLHTGGVIGRKSNMAYADGGTMPGYTPGRDVHRFVSPTGGVLNLSGGEPVMRPEFGAVVGERWVDWMNSVARSQGTSGVRKALSGGLEQSHARGGKIIFPLPGGVTSTYEGHDGVDINANPDEGKPFFSATSGHVTTTGYSRGYGNAVFVASPYGELVYGHSQDGSIAVSPGDSVQPGSFLARVGNTGNSYGAHLHFGFPNGTYAAAMSLLSGAAPATIKNVKAAGKSKGQIIKDKFPGWLIDVAKNPLNYVQSLVKAPLNRLSEKFGNSPFLNMIGDVPGKLIGAVKNKVANIIPNQLSNFFGGGKGDDSRGGDGPAGGDGGGSSFANGGILPYNGTMMYDSGGYLPPGLTTVVNKTGSPEPVFTADQFDKMAGGGRGPLVGTYAPTFNDSDLEAGDVMDEFEWTIRKLGRGGQGKYEGAKS